MVRKSPLTGRNGIVTKPARRMTLRGAVGQFHQVHPRPVADRQRQRHRPRDAFAFGKQRNLAQVPRSTRHLGQRQRYVDRAPVGAGRLEQHRQRNVADRVQRVGESAILRRSRRFREQHVISDRGYLRLRQPLQEPGVDLARPGPAAKLRDARIVDGHEQDAVRRRRRP
jgi:hypothetical protein